MSGRRGEPEAVAERRIKALEMRKMGFTYRQIAVKLDIDVAQAHSDVRIARDRLIAKQDTIVAEMRDLHLLRLEDMFLSLRQNLKEGDIKTVNAAINILKREADLLGLDAPTKQEISTPTETPFKVYVQTSEFNPDDA